MECERHVHLFIQDMAYIQTFQDTRLSCKLSKFYLVYICQFYGINYKFLFFLMNFNTSYKFNQSAYNCEISSHLFLDKLFVMN